ncbi:MAG: tyrosine-type recombinase/integrase, partial [Pseudomonadota bacterium]
MRRWSDAAALPECSAHGLRKAIARRLAEAGSSAKEIASVTGHKTLAEVQRYTDAADREHLADQAFDKLSERTIPQQKVVNLSKKRG